MKVKERVFIHAHYAMTMAASVSMSPPTHIVTVTMTDYEYVCFMVKAKFNIHLNLCY